MVTHTDWALHHPLFFRTPAITLIAQTPSMLSGHSHTALGSFAGQSDHCWPVNGQRGVFGVFVSFSSFAISITSFCDQLIIGCGLNLSRPKSLDNPSGRGRMCGKEEAYPVHTCGSNRRSG
jgi:hypothetical protein